MASVGSTGEVFRDMPALHETSLEKAAVSLLKFELGYGGLLVFERCNPQRIVVRTNVFSCLDETTISSDDPKELLPLWEMAAVFVGVSVARTTSERLEAWNQAVGDQHAGNPFFLVNLEPILAGQFTGKTSLCAYIFQKLGYSAEGSMPGKLIELYQFGLEELIKIAVNINEGLDFTLNEYIEIYR